MSEASTASADEIKTAIEREGIDPSTFSPDDFVLMKPSPRQMKDRTRLLKWVAKWAEVKGMDEHGLSESEAYEQAWRKAVEALQDVPGTIDARAALKGEQQGTLGGFAGSNEPEPEEPEPEPEPDTEPNDTVNLEQFGPGMGNRVTGRVEKVGGVGSRELRAIRSDGEDPPDFIASRVVRVSEDALQGMIEYVPESQRVAQFTYNRDTNELTNMSVSWNPATDPPEMVSDFSWRGETTPSFARPGRSDLDIAKRYSYSAPLSANVRTMFTPRERQGKPVEIPADSTVVQGPVDGTIKPWSGSPVVMHPNGQVVGIDMDAAGNGESRLWIEVVQRQSTGDWTVTLDLRPDSEEHRAPLIEVDTATMGGVPFTRDGAFHAAFTLMTGNSPSSATKEMIQEINRSPEIAAKPDGGEEAEDELSEVLGDLEPQYEEQSKLADESETRPRTRRSSRQPEGEQVDPGQASFGSGGEFERQASLGGSGSDESDDARWMELSEQADEAVEELGIEADDTPAEASPGEIAPNYHIEVKEQSATLSNQEKVKDYHLPIETLEKGKVKVRYLTVHAEKPGTAGPNSTMENWNYNVVKGEVQPAGSGDPPEKVTEAAQTALNMYLDRNPGVRYLAYQEAYEGQLPENRPGADYGGDSDSYTFLNPGETDPVTVEEGDTVKVHYEPQQQGSEKTVEGVVERLRKSMTKREGVKALLELSNGWTVHDAPDGIVKDNSEQAEMGRTRGTATKIEVLYESQPSEPVKGDRFEITEPDGEVIFEAYEGDPVKVAYDSSHGGTKTIEGTIEGWGTKKTRTGRESLALELSTGHTVFAYEHGSIRKDGNHIGRFLDITKLFEG